MYKLTIVIWHVPHGKAPYRDLGADHFARLDPERALRGMTKETSRLGLAVGFEPIMTA